MFSPAVIKAVILTFFFSSDKISFYNTLQYCETATVSTYLLAAMKNIVKYWWIIFKIYNTTTTERNTDKDK